MKYLQRRRRWLRAQRFWARLRAKREQEYLDAASDSESSSSEDSSSEDSSSEGSSGSEGVRAQQRSPRLALTALPSDCLQRVLLGVALDDHDATAAACRAFRAVIRGPRFLRLRREYGFAERRIILLGQCYGEGSRGFVEIHVAGKHGAIASIPGLKIGFSGAPTDGGARLFVSTDERRDGPPHEIVAYDASARRWSRFATLPLNQRLACTEWHGGLLYVAGGIADDYLNSLHAFNEATGLWEDLPPMPRACVYAASGVIGNQLFIAGGIGHEEDEDDEYPKLTTLQIYDFTARTWHLGPPLPKAVQSAWGLVVDDKLYVVSSIENSFQVYDVKSNTWTEQIPPPCAFGRGTHAFAHKGRIVVVERGSGAAFHRGTGSDPNHWSPFDLDMVAQGMTHGVGGSILFG